MHDGFCFNAVTNSFHSGTPVLNVRFALFHNLLRDEPICAMVVIRGVCSNLRQNCLLLAVGAGLDFVVVDLYAVVEVDGDAGKGDVAETFVVVFAFF